MEKHYPSQKKKDIPVIAIVGPTASGKSDCAVACAIHLIKTRKKYDIQGAEIISADSRQVYKGFNLTSGKITKKEMQGIKHHLLDVASPKKTFTVAHYQVRARKAAQEIIHKGKVPILCGGSGFFIDSVLHDTTFPAVKPQPALRQKLEKLSAETLFSLLQKKDKNRAHTIDRRNKRRLIRALEIIASTKKPIQPQAIKPFYNKTLIIGINLKKDVLKERIEKRVRARIQKGMLREVMRLHQNGLSWNRLEHFGLEYRWISRYWQKRISKDEMIQGLSRDICHYAKRQMTWFKRNKNIVWVSQTKHAIDVIDSVLLEYSKD